MRLSHRVTAGVVTGHIDHRIGFTYAAPGTGWEFSNKIPGTLRPVGTLPAWQKKNLVVTLLSIVPLGTNRDTGWVVGFLEKHLRSKLRVTVHAIRPDHHCGRAGENPREDVQATISVFDVMGDRPLL